MVGRLVDLVALLLVAGEAHLRLSLLLAKLFALHVHAVTAGAAQVLQAVGAGMPANAIAILMTRETGAVARFDGCAALLAEQHVGLGVATRLAVLFAIAVAARTGWRAAIGTRAMARL